MQLALKTKRTAPKALVIKLLGVPEPGIARVQGGSDRQKGRL